MDARLDDFPDLVQPFSIEGANVRGRLVRLGPAYAATIEPHGYPAAVAELLGETEALATALAFSLKFDGIFTLQAQGDGPVAMLMADVTSDGGIRAYARIRRDGDGVDTLAAEGGPVPRLMGSGHLAFTVDQGPDSERYQGVTPLEGASLADCAHTYFRQSEQLDTAIKLAAAAGDGRPRAAALMIQRMPGRGRPELVNDEDDESWRRAVILMSSMTTDEMLDPAVTPDRLLYRLYHEDGVRVYETRTLAFHCRCSREKVAAVLSRFKAEQLSDMRTADGQLVATCEFCRAEYAFDDDELASLDND